MHAFLVTIDNEEKMKYITQFLNVFVGFHYNHYWIGLKDAIQEGHWRWVETGSDVGSYTKWKPGQPDGDIAQNCVTTTWNETEVYWMDAKCEGAHRGAHGGYYYICEKVATS